MIFKKIFLLFNIIGLLMYTFIFNEGISIIQNVPASIQAGEEFTVELTVNRGTIAGFAKLQQELPEGCTAKVKESATGNFTFADKLVKIIWMSVPTDPTFKVSYTVSVPKGITVSQIDLGGKISYIENNEKKVFEIPVKTISIGGASAAANNTNANTAANTTTTPTETPNNTAANTATPNITDNTQATNTSTETANTNTAASAQKTVAPGNSICERSVITAVQGKEYTVSVTVKKGTITGFAKLEEIIPAGLTASGLESASGVFSFVDGKVKYLWMSLPAEPEFKISYKLVVESVSTPTFDLNGTFSYLENEETKKSPTPTTTVSLSGGAIAANNTATENTANNTAANSNTANNNTSSNNTATNNTTTENTANNTAANNTAANNTAANNNTSANTTAANNSAKTSVPKQGGIVYRVQVTATHKSVPNTYFNENYKIVGEVYSEMHEGWYKFTTGSFNQYSAARDKRVELSSNSVIPGPFVTAYNSGKRITVQEALMVSNQKWVQ